jgi:Na+-transporting NADH:ubiquinone oxidoreductase subunit NqrC
MEMELNPLTLTFITALISSLASAIVASVVARIRTKRDKSQEEIDKEKEEMDALKLGMRALLWQEINNIFINAKENKGLTVEEKHNLENVYLAYHGLGGNGTGTHLYKEAMNNPIIPSD